MKIKELSKCVRCGEEVEKPHIHHKDRNRNNNLNDNLEIICPQCHGKEHGLEGGELSIGSRSLTLEISKGNEGYRLTEGFHLLGMYG